MSATIIRLPPPVPTALIEQAEGKWRITLRRPPARPVHHIYSFDREGETAEFAVTLRDHAWWTLMFAPGAEAIRALVEEISSGDEP